MRSILITGAAGFIGSTLARMATNHGRVVLFDQLTYAGFMGNIDSLIDNKKVYFVKGDIANFDLVLNTLRTFAITDVMNLAAESHVDNSITGPLPFITTNVLGTFQLLEACRKYWSEQEETKKSQFRLLHVSTDEVFGELDESGFFTEGSPYKPNSPYSASKASSDHLVRAWHQTYNLPTIVTNCSNNYGPRQFPEKLIPRMIDCAVRDIPLPVYGRGQNVRDWIHVEDHCQGLLLALNHGHIGETYCFGGRSERKNIDVVRGICEILDQILPRQNKYEKLIQFVTDRPGHDFRYAIDDSKAEKQLSFKRKFESFESGLFQTVEWYLNHPDWISQVKREKEVQ